ncbi:hypothetical protein A9995_08395 [Erythrobacter sp. QSSC1-22B]|uniref:hypothetical protein n=1 Tax=Erythrobacter sp. QSSC1-22B TaxID=1860125 RepID=UPI000804ED62|nr:hypothetical protein [Erythrobacter sp. QSSC1-22B]OBX19147.1 hypothetical protein A9995_08395 [Erythrobacter sp. QSSC1-22B]
MNWRQAVSGIAILASACASVPPPSPAVTLEIAGAPLSAEETGQAFFYRLPGSDDPAGIAAQTWSMLGREDRAAMTGDAEYLPRACTSMPTTPRDRESVVEAIATRAATSRIVIVNESHKVTRHRETVRELLEALRPFGFTVYAAETFSNAEDGADPVAKHSDLAWPHVHDGYYSREPAFGRAVREAKRLGYQMVAYEETPSQSAPDGADRATSIAARETAQAANLAAILAGMGPDEKLLVHVGYSHAAEVPLGENGDLWMAARLKALTGIDPLTVSQTLCSSEGGEPFLAILPADRPAGMVDIVLSHPVTRFRDQRAAWRRDAGDIAIRVPVELRRANQPLIIEAFVAGEPFDAVPMDRVYLEPGEDIPLLLPPGNYRVRAVIPTSR